MIKPILDDSNFGLDGTGCGNCVYSCATEEEGFVACGCAVEEDPIWSVRLHGVLGKNSHYIAKIIGGEVSLAGKLARAMQGDEDALREVQEIQEAEEHDQYTGMDAERLRSDDGGSSCKAYIRRP